MDKTVSEIVSKFCDSIRKDNIVNPDKIILYGSQAKGNATENSDIDIAVVVNGFTGDVWKASNYLWRTAWHTDSRIEPILMDSSDDESGFCQHVMETGIEL